AQGDFTAGSIQDRHRRAEKLRQVEAGFSRQKWNQLCRETKPDPFKPVTNFFPTRTHRAF
ncbi:MAG: hypothetical protein WA183_10430, partial [Chthoniobacterales bacterium]